MESIKGEKMAKAYWIANLEVADIEGMKTYRDMNREVMKKYGAKFIVLHGKQIVPEGKSRSRQTVVEFPNYDAAIACLNDPIYQAAAKLRKASSECDFVLVEGYDGPQDF